MAKSARPQNKNYRACSMDELLKQAEREQPKKQSVKDRPMKKQQPQDRQAENAAKQSVPRHKSARPGVYRHAAEIEKHARDRQKSSADLSTAVSREPLPKHMKNTEKRREPVSQTPYAVEKISRPAPRKHAKKASPYQNSIRPSAEMPKRSGSVRSAASRRKRQRRKQRRRIVAGLLGIEIFLVLIVLAGLFLEKKNRADEEAAVRLAKIIAQQNGGIPEDDILLTDDLVNALSVANPEIRAQLENVEPKFEPFHTEKTDPAHLIRSYEINVDGTTLADASMYTPAETISFKAGENYTDVDGIVTFRGNNFRDSAAYGQADFKAGKLNEVWSHETGSLGYNETYWSGSGWTGQPLMEKWSKETKAHMNMYDWAKADDDLVEVIYACMDGYIYFLSLETGEPTRDPMYLGYTFKGAGALDPRGYPIMYVGAGYDSNEGTARVFVIDLLDCSVMYTFGDLDEFSLRGTLSYFDSSALVDVETDTLIYPGENGIIYLIKLNTQYDMEAGTLSIQPDPVVKWRYYGTRSSIESYWIGMETSAVIYGGYLFVADNGGILMCLDLNTLKPVWAQDILDDSNSTPVLEMENGHPYLYISTSFHLGWRSYDTAEVPIWKIDAQNGEIVWQTSYTCHSEEALSGGVQSTIALGKEDLSDHLYVTVSKTDSMADGVLACLDKASGEILWEHKAYYTWSSPVCVYNAEGSGRVLYCTGAGKMYLLDGMTGEVYDTLDLDDGMIEASPAVYGDYAVVGIRDCKIFGVKLE